MLITKVMLEEYRERERSKGERKERQRVDKERRERKGR